MCSFIKQLWAFILFPFDQGLQLFDFHKCVVHTPFPRQLVKSQGLHCINIGCLSLGNLESNLFKLVPVSKRHQADIFFSHEGYKCWVVYNTFIHGLKGNIKFLGYAFNRVSCHKDMNFGYNFIFIVVGLLNRLLKFCFIFFFDVPQLVPYFACTNSGESLYF